LRCEVGSEAEADTRALSRHCPLAAVQKAAVAAATRAIGTVGVRRTFDLLVIEPDFDTVGGGVEMGLQAEPTSEGYVFAARPLTGH